MSSEEDEIAKALRLSMEDGGDMSVDAPTPVSTEAGVGDAQSMEASEPTSAQPAEEQLGELPPVDDILFNALKEMGFPENRITKALILTGNASVDKAMDWINEHQDDEDIDDPLVGVVQKPKDDRPLAVRKAEFEERLKAARLKKAERERTEGLQQEIARLEAARTANETREKMEEMNRKRTIDAREREKQADKEERARLRAKIEEDKARRRAEREAAGLPPKEDKPKPTSLRGARFGTGPSNAEAESAKPAPKKSAYVHKVEAMSPEDAIALICKMPAETARFCMSTIVTMLSNIIKDPSMDKFRSISISNKRFNGAVWMTPGGGNLLLGLGFQEREGRCVLAQPSDLAPIIAAVEACQQGIKAVDAAEREADMAERRRDQEALKAKLAADKALREEMKRKSALDRANKAAEGPVTQPSRNALGNAFGSTPKSFADAGIDLNAGG